MKKILVMISFFLLFIPLYSQALVEKSEYEYITDEENILSSDTREYIIEYSKFLKENKHIDFYVVTIHDLEDSTIEDYTDYIYDVFEINSKGLLIVVSKDVRQIRIKAGEMLSDIVTNEIIDTYIEEYFMPYLKEDNWDEGIKNGYSAFFKMLCNYYNIDSSEMIVYDRYNFLEKYKYVIITIFIWINVVIGYRYCDYFKKELKVKNSNFLDTIKFIFFLFINIITLVVAYIILPISVLIILGFEIIGIVSNYNNDSKKKEKVKKYREKISKKYK